MIGIVLIYRLCYFTNVIVNAKYLVTSFVLSDANSGQVYQNNKTKVTAERIVHNLDGILNPVPLSKSYFKRKVNILILKFNLYVDDLIFFNWFDFWQTYSITLNLLSGTVFRFPMAWMLFLNDDFKVGVISGSGSFTALYENHILHLSKS